MMAKSTFYSGWIEFIKSRRRAYLLFAVFCILLEIESISSVYDLIPAPVYIILYSSVAIVGLFFFIKNSSKVFNLYKRLFFSTTVVLSFIIASALIFDTSLGEF